MARKRSRPRVSRAALGLTQGLLCAGLGLVGCTTEDGPTLAWSFSFANADTAARASRVEVSILRGSCSSADVVYREAIGRDGQAPTPPKLESGRYALSGRALTHDCRAIAYGCLQVVLPASNAEQYEVVLDDTPETRACDGVCASGCDSLDDGGAPALDAAMPGADAGGNGGDASADGGPLIIDAATDAAPDAQTPACDDGELGPDDRCYRFVTSPPRSFDEAESDCVSWGGHLVSFNSAAEELWVSERAAEIVTFDEPVRFWIGFTDEQTETLWKWTDGSNDDDPSIIVFDLADDGNVRFKVAYDEVYTHWGDNPATVGNSEPNNGSGTNPTQVPGEDCAIARADRISGPNGVTPRPEWDDTDCSSSRQYVCER